MAAPPRSREERLREFYARQNASDSSVPAEAQLEKVDAHGYSSSSVAQPPAATEQHSVVQSRQTPDRICHRAAPTAEDDEEALKLKKQGNEFYSTGDFEAAVEHYTTAIKTASSGVLHSNRAAAYMMLGWWGQALRDTKIAMRKDPENEKVLERHGKCLLMADRIDDALKVIDDAESKLKTASTTVKAQSTIKRLRWLADASQNASTLEDYRTVMGELSKAETTSPLGTRMRRGLAKTLVDRADALENHRKIRPAVARSERHPDHDLDEISEITPFAEEAIQVTGDLLEDNEDDAELRYLRGKALVRLGRHADAEQQLLKGLEQSPDHQATKDLLDTMGSVDACQVKGNKFYRDGRLPEAIQAYTEGIEKDPNCTDTIAIATLYYNRSAALRKKGEPGQALEDVNTSLALRPKWANALYRRGILLLECGRYGEALTELKTVQRADPTFDEDLESWLRRAHHWLSRNQDEQKDYYRFLRIPMDSTKEEIRKQYHKLALVWHPDKNPSEEGRRRFDELQEAYKFLMDDEKKEEYDFGIWKDKAVRHHAKFREKIKNTWDGARDTGGNRIAASSTFASGDTAAPVDFASRVNLPAGWGDRHLEEDDKVELSTWGDRGAPEWLQARRNEVARERYGAGAN